MEKRERFQRILVAYDFSPQADKALNVAVDMARCMGARGKKSALREALVGSTAEKHFHLCPVPVLSVRLRPPS